MFVDLQHITVLCATITEQTNTTKMSTATVAAPTIGQQKGNAKSVSLSEAERKALKEYEPSLTQELRAKKLGISRSMLIRVLQQGSGRADTIYLIRQGLGCK